MRVQSSRCARVVLLCASVLAIPACAQDPTTPLNLINNGDFESDADGNGSPDGWDAAKPGKSWEVEGGNRFYRLKALVPDKSTSIYRRVTLPIGVRALELSWKQRVSGLQIGKQKWFDARVVVNFKDAEGKQIPGPAPAYTQKDTLDWETRSLKFLVPTGAVHMEMMPMLFNVQAGTLDIDDLTLTVTDAAPLDAAVAAKAQKQAQATARREDAVQKNIGADGEMLPNGDFQQEGKTAGQPDRWDAPKGPVSWANEEGNRFLRLTAPQPDKMVSYYRRVDLPVDTKALELKWKQRVSGLVKGKRPEHDARFIMNFKDAAGRTLKGPYPVYTQKNTTGWIDKSTKFLVPEGAVTLEFMPALFNVQAGTLDVDDLSLKATDAAPLLVLKAKKEAEEKFGNVAPEAPDKVKWPTELRVVGNKVLNREGREVLLRGVNMPSIGWKAVGEYPLRSIMVAIDDWKSNVIRLPVKEEFWFGASPDQKDGGVAYRKLVDDCVIMAANRGAYTVLDLHRFRAPKQVHADFWKEAAAKYKDHPTVIFDLFNEPYSISWEVWRDGGFVEDKTAGPDEVNFLSPEEKALNVKGFRSVGMQKLIDTVRGVGAKNIVIVGGLDYSYDLSGLSEGYMVDEKGGNGMMLSTHIYPQKRDWPNKVMKLADKYPIFVGEFGANTKKFDFMPAAAQEDAEIWVPRILGFMQKYNLHYTGWSFHPSAGPTMLKGWDFAPTPEWGALAKRALAGEQFPYVGMR